jgi:hypothetical protein
MNGTDSEYSTAAAEKVGLIPQIAYDTQSSIVPDVNVGSDFVSLIQRINLTLNIPKILESWYVSNSTKFTLNTNSCSIVTCRVQRIEGRSALRVCCEERT